MTGCAAGPDTTWGSRVTAAGHVPSHPWSTEPRRASCLPPTPTDRMLGLGLTACVTEGADYVTGPEGAVVTTFDRLHHLLPCCCTTSCSVGLREAHN